MWGEVRCGAGGAPRPEAPASAESGGSLQLRLRADAAGLVHPARGADSPESKDHAGDGQDYRREEVLLGLVRGASFIQDVQLAFCEDGSLADELLLYGGERRKGALLRV